MKTPTKFDQWDRDLSNDIVNSKIDWFIELREEHDFVSVWSIFGVNDFSVVPFPGITTLRYEEHWGPKDRPLVHHFEDQVGPPTWMDLWKAAESLIRLSGDTHHVFIEAFSPRGTGTFYLQTGS